MKTGLTILPVSTIDELLGHALAGPLTAIEWSDDIPTPIRASADDEDHEEVIRH